MTTTQTETCAGCGLKKNLTNLRNHLVCPECHALIKGLQAHPEHLGKVLKIAGLDTTAAEANPALITTEKSQELPDVLDAVRYRTTDRDRNTWYVSVSELEGHPVEIFASTAFDRDHHLQSRISNLTTITRLISLILRHVFLGEILTLEKTLTQLHRSSRQKNDLPDMLTRVLSKYANKNHPLFDKETDAP